MEKKAIRDELNEVKEGIKKLKITFFEKKNQKENFFSKGEDYSKEIDKLYEQIKQIEKKSNLANINLELENKKKNLEEYEENIIKFEDELKIAKSKSFDSQKPKIKTISKEKIKKEINDLDLKLQTQVLSLEKESQLIKKISELKNQISSKLTENDSNQSKEIKDILKEIHKIKKNYYYTEKNIRSLYKQIRIINKEKKEVYKEIDKLRELKKASFDNFKKEKKEYSVISKDLKDLFKKEESYLEKLGEVPFQKKKEGEKIIKAKQKEIEDRLMKKGEILTTEDLLLFQKK